MRIWHQSFTVLEDVPDYRDAMVEHFKRVCSPGTQIDMFGMRPGSYPSSYPGTHISFHHVSQVHKQQFIRAAIQAEAQGYDALIIGTIPDTGFEEARSLVDIPVIAFGNASVAFAATLGNCVGIVHFIPALGEQIKRNMAMYGFGSLIGPIVRIQASFEQIGAGYADPAGVIAAFTTAAKEAIDRGANVIIPGEGPLNMLLAKNGVTRIGDVPVIDSLGTLIQIAEARVAAHRRGLYPSREGFYYAKPPQEALDHIYRLYGSLEWEES